MTSAPFPQLQAFLAVARLRSFSSAARELGVSRSAVSHAVRQLEEKLRVVLLARTTRSVALTDPGRRLVDAAGPGLGQVVAALANAAAQPGETVGRLRLSAPRMAVPFVITSVLPTFRARHPRVEVEVDVEDRFVDIVAEGYDAGIRLSEAIERDMVQVRLTDAFRFVVVGAPSYLERHGTPQKPEDLLRHECITFRAQTTGALYAFRKGLPRSPLSNTRTRGSSRMALVRFFSDRGCRSSSFLAGTSWPPCTTRMATRSSLTEHQRNRGAPAELRVGYLGAVLHEARPDLEGQGECEEGEGRKEATLHVRLDSLGLESRHWLGPRTPPRAAAYRCRSRPLRGPPLITLASAAW